MLKRRFNRWGLLQVVLCGTFVGLAPPSHAQAYPYRTVQVQGSANANGGGNPTRGGSYFFDGFTDITGEASGSLNEARSLSQASASSDFGRLAASARADSFVVYTPPSPNPGSGAQTYTQAWARWGDQVTITSPLHEPGSYGIFTAPIRVSGELTVGASPYFFIPNVVTSTSRALANVSLYGTGIDQSGSSNACQGNLHGGAAYGNIASGGALNNGPPGDTWYCSNLGTEIEAYVRFTFGIPLNLDYQLVLTNLSDAASRIYLGEFSLSPEAVSSADLTQTLLWGGISRVVDDSGQTITDYSLSSLSGFDYTKPAQEPSTADVPAPLPLLGVGAAFGFSRKLRKRIKSNKQPVASAIDWRIPE